MASRKKKKTTSKVSKKKAIQYGPTRADMGAWGEGAYTSIAHRQVRHAVGGKMQRGRFKGVKNRKRGPGRPKGSKNLLRSVKSAKSKLRLNCMCE